MVCSSVQAISAGTEADSMVKNIFRWISMICINPGTASGVHAKLWQKVFAEPA